MTAGPNYSPSTHQQVSVNGADATKIDSDIITAWVRVRIKDYHGLPHGSPASSPYFDHKLHTSDRYSIAYSFVPKQDMSGTDLVMGFDYDHSIRHQLPPGFKYAMKIATSMLDPGLYSDPYSDEPYLYGPALSSFFAFNIGEQTSKVSADDQRAELDRQEGGVIEEGATGSGKPMRDDLGLPTKWKKRRKHYLDAQALTNFTFEKGRMYHADFFNPHLDFANFSLRLPGFSISVAKYVDEKTHHLRYVLKNRKTEEVLFVVFFKLLFGKELDDKLEREKSDKSGGSQPASDGSSRTRSTQQGDPERAQDVHLQIADTNSQPPKAKLPETQPLSAPPQEQDEDQGMISSATSVASNLANSIYGVYAALGFANSSSSSGSESSSRSSTPQPSGTAVGEKIDDMDDATVEQYLQARHGSMK